MDNTNVPLATPPEIEKAKALLVQAGLMSAGVRLMAESVIASKSQSAVTELTKMLEDLIREKEAAYLEYKTQVSSVAKKAAEAKEKAQ